MYRFAVNSQGSILVDTSGTGYFISEQRRNPKGETSKTDAGQIPDFASRFHHLSLGLFGRRNKLHRSMKSACALAKQVPLIEPFSLW
jgi:hypothetical protein